MGFVMEAPARLLAGLPDVALQSICLPAQGAEEMQSRPADGLDEEPPRG